MIFSGQTKIKAAINFASHIKNQQKPGRIGDGDVKINRETCEKGKKQINPAVFA